ncbi:hypothetical protein ACLB0R_01170 [Sphingomonas sp. GlSt437]|uniref:hypothetical protein n=1 Tax=Sphingomonas sp. GlSt437 TaxID=3389970 RepID=UPI003A842037
MTEWIDRLYAGRFLAVFVACAATVMLAIAKVFVSPAFPPPSFTAVFFVPLVVLYFVGVPAFLGITLIMIPTQTLVKTRSVAIRSFAVMVANCLFVDGLWAVGVLPGEYYGALSAKDGVRYLAVAAIAAGIWLLSDYLFRRPVDA